MDRLPQTLKDAIEIAKNLEISYIWIDSLCIIQDDEQDKSKELRSMGDIYKNATLTIVAASAWNANQGFLQPRKPLVNLVDLPLLNLDGRSSIVSLTPEHPYPTNIYFRENPIENRAWTFQERLLSPRMLIYSNTNLRWLCRSKSAYDGGNERLLSSHDVHWGYPFSSSENWSSNWRHVVGEYSRRKMAIEGDKFPAISAIAREHASCSHDEYIAGLWRSTLAHDLLWIVAGWKETFRRSRDYRAPSWSWAAVEGPVSWTYGPNVESLISQDDRFEFLSYDPSLYDDDMPFGKLSGGILRLRCCIVQLGSRREILEKAVDPENSIRFDDDEECPEDSQPIYGLLTGWKDDPSKNQTPVPVGLLLCQNEAKNDGSYQRVGIFFNTNCPAVAADVFDNCIAKDTSLV
jgi:hypothetical protein